MAYIFLDDGYPDACDYDNNYFHFNENNPDTLARIINLTRNCDINDSQIKTELRSICRESYETESVGDNPIFCISWLKRMSSNWLKRISMRFDFRTYSHIISDWQCHKK